MRALLVTDSLGMPRRNISIEKTWTRIILNNNREKIEIFTFLRSGLTTYDIISESEQILGLFEPNIVIFQVGIVDCVRRVLSKNMITNIERIPVISKKIRDYISLYHYQLTKFREVKYVDNSAFSNNIDAILKKANERNVNVAFLRIAGPGRLMQEKTYNCCFDIEQYNQIIQNCVERYSNAVYIDPYKNIQVDKYVLPEDGYHLNEYGCELVAESVGCFINKFFSR